MSWSPEPNPFEAPREGGFPFTPRAEPAGPAYRLATGGQRFLNFVVDTVVCYFLAFVTGVGIVIAMIVTGMSPEDVDRLFDGPAGNLVGNLAGIGVVLVYYVLLEALSGRTLGKLLSGTKVVREDGDPPTTAQIIGRTAARFIPFEPFSVLSSSESVGWHDTLSKTRVVRVR